MTAALSALASPPVVLDDLPLRIDRDEVLRFQGYKRGLDVPSADVLAIFDEALAAWASAHGPASSIGRSASPAKARARSRRAASGCTIPEIGRLWGPLEAVGAGICTVGDAIEARVRALFDAREFPLAVMLDSVGSAAVESLAEYANDLLCQARPRGGRQGDQPDQPGLRGVGHRRAASALWPVLRASPSASTLNDACFMTPAKSITFLVGDRSRRRASTTTSPSAGAAGCGTAPTAARPPPSRVRHR